MKAFTLKQLDEFRKNGFRPEIVACFVHDKKILFVLKRSHGLWHFPQGGIENKETPEKAFLREMGEELGEDFLTKIDDKLKFFGEDEVEFLPEKFGMKELKTDDGTEVLMKGKKYLFYVVEAKTEDLKLADTEFDDYIWLSYESGTFISKRLPQASKRRIISKVLDLLKAEKLL